MKNTGKTITVLLCAAVMTFTFAVVGTLIAVGNVRAGSGDPPLVSWQDATMRGAAASLDADWFRNNPIMTAQQLAQLFTHCKYIAKY